MLLSSRWHARAAAGTALVALLGLGSPALAARNVWTPHGQHTGRIQSFTLDPFDSRILYATAYGNRSYADEVYRSTDGGQSWTFAHHGLGSSPIGALEADPVRRYTLYAANSQGELFRSTDRGASWRLVSRANLRPGQMLVLSQGPGRPLAFYLVGVLGSLQRSLNGGATWTTVLQLADREHFEGPLAADPTNPRRLYVSDGRRILKSEDAGTTWNPLPPPPPEPGPDSFFGSRLGLAGVAPGSPPALIAFRPGALYRSVDFGRTWRRTGIGDGVRPEAFAAGGGPSPARTWLGISGGQVLASTDGGATWRLEGRDMGLVFQLRARAGTGTVFANTYSHGLMRQPSPGRPWQTLSSSGLLFDGEPTFHRGPDPRVIFRGAGDTVSVDGGRTFVPTGVPPQADNVYGYRVEVDPAQPQVRYSATRGGVYRSLDGGRTWSLRGRFTPPPEYHPEVVPRLTLVSGETLLATAGCGLSRSTDGGATWQTIQPCTVAENHTQYLQEALIHPLDPRTVFLRTFELIDDGSGTIPPPVTAPTLWRSRDGGASFEKIVFGWTKLTFAPGDPRQAYLVQQDGLWRSSNGGETFARVAPLGFDQGLRDLEVDSHSPGTLYAAVNERGVLRSRDGGTTWAAINNGLARYLRLDVDDLVADPAVSGLLYAYPRRGGCFAARFD